MFSKIVHHICFKLSFLVLNKIPLQLLKRLKRSTKKKIYFGNTHGMSGGPKIRTGRMISHFGNQLFLPSIIYAQSCWGDDILRDVCQKNNVNRYKIVFNQNGWYYPGWYNGDWRGRNLSIIELQKKSQIVIYQSKFCYEAGLLLNNYEPKKSVVIHNAINLKKYEFLQNRGDGRTVWLSGLFAQDAWHILEPALEAFKILREKHGKYECPRLLITGDFTQGAKKAKWWPKTQTKLLKMQDDMIIEWVGKYNSRSYQSIAKKVDIALHLKYKDPCPNAVIERMASGIPHVYSCSGGTKELVGDAGIGLNVRDCWDEQVKVDHEELAVAIDLALENKDKLSLRSHIRSKEFGWDKYVNEHQNIFENI